jgi:hypothetical protein
VHHPTGQFRAAHVEHGGRDAALSASIRHSMNIPRPSRFHAHLNRSRDCCSVMFFHERQTGVPNPWRLSACPTPSFTLRSVLAILTPHGNSTQISSVGRSPPSERFLVLPFSTQAPRGCPCRHQLPPEGPRRGSLLRGFKDVAATFREGRGAPGTLIQSAQDVPGATFGPTTSRQLDPVRVLPARENCPRWPRIPAQFQSPSDREFNQNVRRAAGRAASILGQ